MPSLLAHNRAIIAALVAFMAVTWLTLPPTGTLFTVRPVDPQTGRVILGSNQGTNVSTDSQKFATESFSPDQYVTDQWDERVLPWLRENAVGLGDLMRGLKADRQATLDAHGVSPGETSGYSFVVRGEGTVTSVDTSTPVGKVMVRPAGAGDPAVPDSVTLLVGPLVVSSALRDALPFITLDNFTNQVQYADVAQSLNDRAIEAAVPSAGPDSLTGERITFLGAFTLGSGGVEITPVSIEAGG